MSGGPGAETEAGVAEEGRGIALMALAMLAIPAADGIAKHLSETCSPLFISWARYAVASLIVVPFAWGRYGRAMFPRENLAVHLLRTAFLVAAMTLYFLAIARVPLATAVTAYFVGPVAALALAVPLLRERLTAHKLVSIALGAAGALAVLRPTGSVDPGIVMALGAGLLFACYLVATRHASRREDAMRTLVFQCVAGTLLLTPQAAATFTLPPADILWLFAALGAVSVFGHLLSITAFRFAEASTLAPLVYLELVGAAAIGFLVFGEVPAAATVLGALLIVLSGLVLARR